MLSSPGLQSLLVRVQTATQTAFADSKGHGASQLSDRDTRPTPSVAKYARRQEAF